MANRPTRDELGPPALEIGELQLWVHGYEFPDLTDDWDSNWLRITAHAGEAGASVWVSGALVMNRDIASWADECDALRVGQRALAELAPLEPNLKITIRPTDSLGHFAAVVEITPDHMNQRHSFDFEFDQTFLSVLSSKCRAIIRRYPIREHMKRGV